MSANPVTWADYAYTYDFTNTSGQIYGDLSGHTVIAPGIWGMIAGDSDGNGWIDDADKSDKWNNEAGSSGYHSSDFNFDAEVSNSDKNEYLVPNELKNSQIPD